MNHHKWTDQEICQLHDAIKLYGLDWKQIQAEFFPHLTALTIKNKYYKKTKSKQHISIKEEMEGVDQDQLNRQRKPKQQIQAPQFQIPEVIHFQPPNLFTMPPPPPIYHAPSFQPLTSDFALHSNNMSIDFNQLNSLPWTRAHSLPQTNEPSIIADDEVADNKDFVSQLIQSLQQKSQCMFSPVMSPGEKSEN